MFGIGLDYVVSCHSLVLKKKEVTPQGMNAGNVIFVCVKLHCMDSCVAVVEVVCGTFFL